MDASGGRRAGRGPWRAARELAERLGETVPVDLRHPAWWGLLAGAGLLEWAARGHDAPGVEALYPTFLSANGDPASDTVMAWPGPALDPAPAARVARAVIRARAAVEALERLDGAFPGQPLRHALAWRDGWLTRAPATDRRVAFITPGGAWLARLGEPGDDATLARALGAVLAGDPPDPARWRRVDPTARAPVTAAVAVAIAEPPLTTARHLHRAAWSAGGGPWLGLGEVDGLALATTCHLAIDGYAHARLCAAIGAAVAARDLGELAAAARAGLDGVLPALPPLPAVPGSRPLGVAFVSLRGAAGDFPRAAYAFGRTLHRVLGGPPGAPTPTFLVPVAPGEAGDPVRRRRRVLFALACVRDDGGGAAEGYASFARRWAATLPGERAGDGALARLLTAACRAPLPDPLRRVLLRARRRPHPWCPPIELLRGRGTLSSLRFAPGEAPPGPLYAVSSPGLDASQADRRGAVVLTLVHHERGCAATLSGTGLAGTTTGARELLEVWLEELAAVERLAAPGAARKSPRSGRHRS